MTDPTDELDLVDALAQLSFLVQGVFAGLAAEHDMSPIQARLLGVLRDREPTMNELGRHLGLDKSSISGLVDRAQRRGLVERTVSADDRRVVHVSLTPAARATVAAAAAAFAERIEALTADVSESDRRALVRATRRILDADPAWLG
ncbi:MarR family winged helix-turn-helix transcriptional regulator [Nocardioides conyzicola]|uniref:HTH marR-type domain-containing protein n=1 Tax=Nocardioides conyzicola TaxID=1651781 RepID=A0ABP8XNN0_9ACTN